MALPLVGKLVSTTRWRARQDGSTIKVLPYNRMNFPP